MNEKSMSKVERSCLCYLETCAVDAGGVVESIRMNAEDFLAVERFKSAGLLTFGRVPGRLLGTGAKKTWTHWVRLTDAGWTLAGACRKRRSSQHGPFAADVFALVIDKQKEAP